MTAVLEAARLVDGDVLVLVPSDLWDVSKFDLGFPVVREVTDERPDADGTDDETALFGARAVSVTLSVTGDETTDAAQALDELGAFLRPGRRPWLYYRMEGHEERCIQLRIDQAAAPLAVEQFGWVDASLAWKAPTGRSQSTVTKEASATAGGAESGRAYDRTGDRVYPATAGTGSVVLTVGGNIATDPVIRILGPCTDPRIANDTTGKTMELVGLALAAGEYLELDVAARTIRLNGEGSVSANRYRFLDFAASSWWDLVPGPNTIRFYPLTSSVPAQAAVSWSDAWL